MRLSTFTDASGTRIGKIDGDWIHDIARHLPGAPATMRALLSEFDHWRKGLEAIGGEDGRIAIADVRLEAPVSDPSKYLAIGLNYTDHIEEVRAKGVKIPETQLWFNKQVSCITGPYDPIHLPRVSEKLDYEAELGVVIGRRCRHVPVAEALSVVAGYLVVDDVTVRDWQLRTGTWTLGKSFDTHGPIGPWLVTADEIPDPQALDVRLYVNGTQRQAMSTAGMHYPVAEQIAYLSTVMTLEPGDIIATGTSGGAGATLSPQVFLKIGDRVRVEIDGIGHIENEVIAEPA